MFTPAEVARHASSDDCWVIVADHVYDVTAFLDDHPGGKAGTAIVFVACAIMPSHNFANVALLPIPFA